VGFRVVDELASRLGVSFKKRLFRSYWRGKTVRGGDSLYLVKPLTFMNASGQVFPEVLRETGLSPEEILVVCDSLDLSPGNCRLKLKGSSGGHKGLDSIIRRLGTDGFMRLLIGIGRPAYKGQVVDYVLDRPGQNDSASVERGVTRAVDAVLLLLAEGPTRVMNEINAKEPNS
jgi:PTH1 family peptidyl-tRNA hydrolase